jgi:hypothetical protein
MNLINGGEHEIHCCNRIVALVVAGVVVIVDVVVALMFERFRVKTIGHPSWCPSYVQDGKILL